MKQIKLRAWDKKKKEYWHDVLCELADNDLYEDVHETGELSMWSIAFMMKTGDDSRFDFEQYTGRKDRNDKEIYEGDRWQRESFIGIVTFEFSGWNLKKAEDSGCYQYPSFYSNASTGTIIGNIHEGESQ